MSIIRPKPCGIYAIRNGDRAYVGSSSNILKRWSDHRYHLCKGDHDSPHLQNAWNKYGEDVFEFIVLEECAVEALLEREQYHLDQYLDNYNCAPIAGTRRGVPHSDETRAKMSASRRRREITAETKARLSAALMGNTNHTGHVHSHETRQKMSASQKERFAREREEKKSDDRLST